MISLVTNESEIFNRLESMELDDVRRTEEDEYAAMDKLTKRINQLDWMVKSKDYNHEANARFLTNAVIWATWRLGALQRTPGKPS